MFFRCPITIRRIHKPQICWCLTVYKAFFKVFLYSKVRHLLLKDFFTDETRPAGAGRTAFDSEGKTFGDTMPDHVSNQSGDR